MFDNASGKIKLIAKILFWIEVVGSIGIGITAFEEYGIGGIFFFMMIFAGGVLGAYFSNLLLYAFGELVEKAEKTNYDVREGNAYLRKIKLQVCGFDNSSDEAISTIDTQKNSSSSGDKICKSCGAKNDKNSSKCRLCDASI